MVYDLVSHVHYIKRSSVRAPNNERSAPTFISLCFLHHSPQRGGVVRSKPLIFKISQQFYRQGKYRVDTYVVTLHGGPTGPHILTVIS
jgi:hypothetical protein